MSAATAAHHIAPLTVGDQHASIEATYAVYRSGYGKRLRIQMALPYLVVATFSYVLILYSVTKF